MNGPSNMPIAPSAEIKHVIAFRQCKPFAEDAKVRVISSHNPWRRKAIAWNLFEKVLRPKPETTIKQILDDAEAIGYFRTDAARHLRWLFTWGDFIEINGVRYFPGVEFPAQEPVEVVPAPEPVREEEVVVVLPKKGLSRESSPDKKRAAARKHHPIKRRAGKKRHK